jgi:hypothetical protein
MPAFFLTLVLGLDAFLHQVGAFEKAGTLTATQVQTFNSEAKQVKTAIQG